ncbi:MAG: CBS domain-containing protein [Methanosphaera stadtmanae]|nr:CBS domain-containing protein [Methanosphaera stadtmanae]
MLTSVQKEILQSLINLYRQSKCTSVKCENIAELMGRNSGTIRNQMQSLRSLGLVKGVPGPRGGYKPTLEAYQTLNIENDPCQINIPFYVNGRIVPDISVNKIEFNSILRPGNCEATISVLGNIKHLDLDDTVKIGPTPVNNLTVTGVIIGRDDVDNVLLLKTNNIQSVPNVPIKSVATEDVVTINPNLTLSEIAKILITKNIRGVPVMVDNEIQGIVMYKHLVQMISEEKYDLVAKDVMSTDFVTVKEDMSLIGTLDKMYKNNLSLIILLDDDNNLAGIATFSDIIKRLVIS